MLNLAVLAVMLVAATYMGRRMSLARDLAWAEKQRVSAELAITSARSDVLFLLSTVPRSRYGLGSHPDTAVALDGRPYRIGKNVLVRLQDIRGQISLNAVSLDGPGKARLERLAATYGLDQAVISRLVDDLLDYRDADDLRRINGAEKEEYAQAGRGGGIRNADILSPTELTRILGFDEIESLWGDDPLSDHVQSSRNSLFNPNSAGWRELMAATGIGEEMAKSLVLSRRTGKTPDISGMVYSGGIGDPFGQGATVAVFPSETVIATLQYVGAPSGVRMAIKHMPTLVHAPWLIQYTYRVNLNDFRGDLDDIPELPAASELRDFSEKYRIQLPF